MNTGVKLMNSDIRAALAKAALDDIQRDEDREFFYSIILGLGEDTSYAKHTKICERCCFSECYYENVPSGCPYLTEHLVF